MAGKTGGRLWGVLRSVAAWLYGMVFKKGWPRWVFLGIVVALLLLIASILGGGADYRRDPSALVPRESTYLYAETRELGDLLKNLGSWKVWTDERRDTGSEQWSKMHLAFANLLSGKIVGMSSSLPRSWLTSAKKAALGFSVGDSDEPESWAVYLEVPDVDAAMAALRVESGLTLEAAADSNSAGVFQLTGNGRDKLFFGAVSPWLIISSDSRLPEFALESLRKPAFSLANSGLLPGWRRDTSVRGIFNPSYLASRPGPVSPLGMLGGWMKPEARWSFASSVDADGVVDSRFTSGELSSQVSEGGTLWLLFQCILFLVALLCLLLVLATLSVMIGWSGWFKFLAVKAGIVPKPAPEPVQPSDAFREDAGIREADARVVTLPGQESEEAETGVGETPAVEDSASSRSATSETHPEK